MAVPKQKTSKSKKRSRKKKWTNQAVLKAKKALSLAKSVINNKHPKSFIYLNRTEKEID
uniref:Large ribosomal subunit protein bL32c n=1 Tax=Sciadococcus taiwanensis TaxID=3028030 RepID=A0A9Y1I237_9RHOD|nr:ribosomal protein L32 [Sciadococcus taiwanensis]